jgi:hypothetical protein
VRRNPQHRSILTVVSATSTCGRASCATSERTWQNFSASCEPLYATNSFHCKQELFLYEYRLHWVPLPTNKRTTERWSSVVHSSSTVAILTTETSLWTCVCIPRLSGSWNLVLPIDTHRKPLTYFLCSCFIFICDPFTVSPSY